MGGVIRDRHLRRDHCSLSGNRYGIYSWLGYAYHLFEQLRKSQNDAHCLEGKRDDALLELGQRIDAGNGEHRCPGEGVDHIGLHGPFCENDSGRRPACEMDPAFGAAAVGLLRAGDPAELPAGDLVSPDLEALDLTVGIADRDQNPALLMDEGPRPRLSPVEARHACEI